MSDIQFSAPSEVNQAFLAEATTLSEQMAEELVPGFRFDQSVSDLEMLQAIVDSAMLGYAADPMYLLRCLGAVFGNVIRTSLPGLAWTAITDDYGCDLGLRFRETSIIIFPVTMLSKRAEDGRQIELVSLHAGVVEQVQTMIASGEYR